jgi:hypothetical protein
MTCGVASTDAIEEVVTASTSGLQNDPATGLYQYSWKTDEKMMSGRCVRLDLQFVDGQMFSATFKPK